MTADGIICTANLQSKKVLPIKQCGLADFIEENIALSLFSIILLVWNLVLRFSKWHCRCWNLFNGGQAPFLASPYLSFGFALDKSYQFATQ